MRKSVPCADIYQESGDFYMLTLCVDVVLLLARDLNALDNIERKLMRRLSMTDMGEVSLVLGMGVTRDREEQEEG